VVPFPRVINEQLDDGAVDPPMKTVEAQRRQKLKRLRKPPPEVGDSAMRGEAGIFWVGEHLKTRSVLNLPD
jgi:hypothetical protein